MIDWVTIARGRKEDQGHTVVALGENDDPWRRRAYLRCQCGAVYSAHESGRAWRTHEVHKARELARK